MDRDKGSSLSREKDVEQDAPKRRRQPWAALLARLLLVPFLLFFSLVVGLIIGYAVLGNGPVSEVFDLNTYKHMYDLIFAGT